MTLDRSLGSKIGASTYDLIKTLAIVGIVSLWAQQSAVAGPKSVCDFVASDPISEPVKCLPVVQIRQEKNLCVPTAAAMVLSYYGVSHSPREIKTRASGHIYDPKQSFNDFTITPYNSLISGLTPFQIHWLLKNFNNNDIGLSIGLAEIKSQIDFGHPVLVDLDLSSVGHTLVVVGYNQSKHVLFLADPDFSPPGFRQFSFDDFTRIWNSNTTGANVRAAVFTLPPT